MSGRGRGRGRAYGQGGRGRGRGRGRGEFPPMGHFGLLAILNLKFAKDSVQSNSKLWPLALRGWHLASRNARPENLHELRLNAIFHLLVTCNQSFVMVLLDRHRSLEGVDEIQNTKEEQDLTQPQGQRL